MSLKDELEDELGSMMYLVTGVTIKKDDMVNGEEAIKISARKMGNAHMFDFPYLDAYYLKRNKMTNEEIAKNYAHKLDLWLRGTLDEV